MACIENYCHYFDADIKEILAKSFYKLTPGANNPYNDLYTAY